MRAFSYHIPTQIEFGNGAIARLPEFVKALGGSRVLVVGDPGVQRAGLIDRVQAILTGASIFNAVFADVESDPATRSVDEGTVHGKANGCDLVVGIGGGSALDTAKAIGLMLVNDGNIKDYVGIGKVPRAGAPVIAVPTTAGTGSELTIWSVLSDKVAKAKISVGSVLNCPAIALLDPELTLSLPPQITAATGMDALTHALESYVNTATQPISEAMSDQAMTLIARSLRKAVADGSDVEARGDMLLASTIAAMAFNSTRLGLVHAFAMPLGAKFGIPHGLVNAIMLPGVMRFNHLANPRKFARIAEIFGEKTASLPVEEVAALSVSAIEKLKLDVGITAKLSNFGVTEGRFDEIVDEAMLSGNVPVNPRQPTKDDMKALLRAELV
ncbi:MAG: iron-containing alcohol dehydrogenase [Desulfomicrobium sp.]|jgi:alcohol dehydrogenase|uniref:iron-containing alcohol dehydrogenase n=2 Tax=Alphaproteobacteria TaxID=28211 RepID=UPI0025BE9380|nr:iron-containing alcohol dehydrogenase [Hoeflea sp.]MBL0937219.1 iron-containing alcohol dehydrogenase [Rhizobiaceae bacterium]MBU4529362.1 iron-containing alcohol dehydrogenase [Alphaproteobacteria bacterium]MBV1712678.1 iron-containing alcohol dehydrogenase [Desulfomicrobium sp.]MBU4545033.1 iron-containing alcohol dehydrogenase [Alphaproteobacteria bacterium]MBU4552440.1 iron-containing alcohol dehydrogenase [Alphaproteobacteria bacterium]